MSSLLVLPALRALLSQDGVRPLVSCQEDLLDTGDPLETAQALARQAEAGEELPGLAVTRPSPYGRLRGRTVLVTGAAQGFGLGIAEQLMNEGAVVAMTDVNEDLVHCEAARLALHLPGQQAAFRMDVADEDSVREAVEATVRAFGGIDLLVSNAGVLKAESLKTQSASDFDFVTRVNYRGFFLLAKHASPYMAMTRRADPSAWTDIVQVNSKSGLQGSNRNGAYAGSKFGSIGLVQSFALELLEDGVKVNAVCPGNFFEGPLWMDPEKGLFAQYLRTGKVPGAQTLDDVKKAYEAKVPMGRGCQTADVVKAILYLVEQEYETGQALPVTGGQVMLS